MHRRTASKIMATFIAGILAANIVPGSATASSQSDQPAPPAQNVGEVQYRRQAAARSSVDTVCSPSTSGKQACLNFGYEREKKAGSRTVPPTTSAVNPYPQICADSGTDGGVIYADSRKQVCRVLTGAYLYTTQTTGGVTRETGRLYIDFWDWTYSSPDLPNWNHQGGVVAVQLGSYGPPTASTVTGSFGVAGQCTVNGNFSFPSQPMLPYGTIRSGEGSARTTALAAGAVGTCSTAWSLTWAIPGYNPVVASAGALSEIRCDNAVGGYLQNPVRPGCVVPWYAESVVYSQSRYPSLASHVARAQASGLPGLNWADPLFRSTDPADESTNRALACGDAPSLPGLSCDEYPLATTYNGLRYGGTRRTFTGCQINAPTNVTGRLGASACMITASENSAQGGLMSGFYYFNRVLDTDPFLVEVGP